MTRSGLNSSGLTSSGLTSAVLTMPQRWFVSLLRAMTKVGAGHDMQPIHEEMVRTLGVGGTMKLMRLGAEVTSRLAHVVGDYTAQTVIAVAAMWNGCRYCVIGHNFSANLFRFRDVGLLGPLDEVDIVDMMSLTDRETLEALRSKFETSEPRTWHLLERMYQLRFQAIEPVEPEDQLLKATLAYWEWLNECTIVLGIDAGPDNVPALGFMRPPAKLLRDYHHAREVARTSGDGPAGDGPAAQG